VRVPRESAVADETKGARDSGVDESLADGDDVAALSSLVAKTRACCYM